MTTTAKDLFALGDYLAAEQAFLDAAKDAKSSADRSLQLSNASQCVLKLFLHERAVQHAREAILLDPRNAKAHYRLAVAYAAMPLPQNAIDAARRCCDIAMANARAFALIRSISPDKHVPEVVGFEVVSRHDHPVSARAADLLRHVLGSQVVLVTNAIDIVFGCGGVAVLVPNCQIPVLSILPTHIVGLDDSATIHAFSRPHALYLRLSSLSAWCMRFEGASDAMICTESDLALIDCSIYDHDEHGILVVEDTGTALTAFCTLKNCTAGIEVREGASAKVVRSEIVNMSQKGIIAYGGARSVALEEVLIENVGIEGVQCLGPRAPAVFYTPDMGSLRRGPDVNPIASAVAEAAATSARENVNSAQLVVTMRNCCLRRCGNDRSQIISSGMTIDQGASALIQGCLFTRCGMASVFIKGGCNVSMQHCRIDHGNSGDAGVRVDVNYDGKVNIEHSVFVGKPAQAIIDGFRSLPPQQRALGGARSAPIQKRMIKAVSRARNAPSIESLRNELELSGRSSEHATSSNKTELPNLLISGGAGALYRQLGSQYTATEYPIGNTYGKDVLRFAESKRIGKREALVVLGACGDIRNLVETICALEEKQLQKVRFLLNDISIWILARNITLLQLACVSWPNRREGKVKQGRGQTKGKRPNHHHKRAARIWLHAWGSIALTPGDRSALDKVLTNLTAGKLPEWLSLPSTDVRNALVSCWSEWASCKRTLREVRNERDALATLTTAGRNVAMMKAALAAGLRETEACELLRNAELLKGGGEKVNPTLLTSGLHYNMYESSIFRAIDMRTFVQGDVNKLHAAACDVMNAKGSIVARALLSGVVNIEIQPGDLTHVLRSQRDVDAVELSNALDYISKPACLISAASCLSRPGGVLSLHTMMAQIVERNVQSLRVDWKEYFLHGANSEDLTEVLGLRSIQIGSETADLNGDGINARSRWVYQAKSYDLSQTGNHDKLRTSMMNAAKAWCRGPSPARQSGFIRSQIAAWPSAIAALHVVSTSMSSAESQVTELVTEMCNASPAIRPFELELNAHAAIMTGKESDLVLATLRLDGLLNRPTIGMQVHLILQLGLNLGEDNEETIWLFDVFQSSASHGVCEVIVKKDDVLRMSSLSARLCVVESNKGVLKGETQTATCLVRGGTLKTRELSDSEITAMRKVLFPDPKFFPS